ncbi:hypothetical protein C8R44DRAFT_611840 [Mycena epipterygia]|nr:hypothetical protein C8R44DRAFT_611840 [Mycena epipterygia]
MDQNALEYIINHLFLPPKLPQGDDTAPKPQAALLRHLSVCAKSFCEGLEGENTEIKARWNALRRTLDRFAEIHSTSSNISQGNLEGIINGMLVHDVLCLHIACQNAGVILRRRETCLSLEFFQASPSAALVTGTTGKLIIQYPSRPRLSLPLSTTFIKSLSALLADLGCTEMADSLPKTVKAGSEHVEYRDVGDIRYISELLGGIARGLAPVASAAQVASSTVYTTKRINDHVLWKSAFLPWRRSPKWLIIRVALQTTIEEWGIPEKYGYKVFITFVLAKTLELARSAGVSDDVLFVMSAKVSARMWKLQSVLDVQLHSHTRHPFPIRDFIVAQVSAVGSLLNEHWKHVQDREAGSSMWAAPTRAQITAAQAFTLPRSSAHLQAVKARASLLNAQQMVFQASEFEQSLLWNDLKQTEIASGECTPELWFKILALEQRIANWKHTMPSPELLELAALIEEHEKLASSFRSQNPEVFSRIFLAVLELWVALDKSATARFPRLLDYSPELSVNSFEPLLLPELSQMRRLHEVELHLAKRHTGARYPEVSVFAFSTDCKSLASRHFSSDRHLQTLWNEIATQAFRRRDEKLQELRSVTSLHASLLAERNRLDCESESRRNRRGNTTLRHSRYCKRCAKEKQANSLTIEVFEWPLPEVFSMSCLVLFELCLPEAFGVWRDTTYRLARNHSNCEPKDSSSPAVVLQNYPLLKDHFVSHNPEQCISIASTAKSFHKSHYRGCNFPCTDSEVVKAHPLKYQLWDDLNREWLPSAFPTVNVRRSCTPSFPSGPYQSLTWAAVATTHTPNDVIARQSECPVQLSYHEWENFGHLRAGVRLQWRNIILQLITGAISLADPAVFLLFRQAAWQAETANEEFGYYREAHFDLSQKDFGVQIVDVLNKRLESISGNWKEGWTAATLGVVACRLLSLNTFPSVQQKALDFLSRLRRVLFDWMKQVLDLLSKASLTGSPAVPRDDLVHRVLQLAASCRSTYAVGSEYLFHDRVAVFIFIRCLITLHAYSPPKMNDLPSALRYLLEHDTIIATETLAALIDAISRNRGGLDDAIIDVWQGFCRDAEPWRKIGRRWMACMTSDSSDRRVRAVHVNLLEGSLLVDGQAQGTLPKEIIRHSSFMALFPKHAALDIVPSTMKGMDCQSRENMDGFEVHFKLNDDDLLIRIRDSSDRVSEFIPPKHLEGDIPNHLLIGMVHIFHEQHQSMDIYPAPSGWEPRVGAAWRMDLALGSRPTLRRCQDAAESMIDDVLDPSSRVVQQLSEIFRPLEASETNLMVYLRSDPWSQQLHIGLPRYKLEFSASLGGLESKELPGFYVSPTQSIGTLIGLRSKLVLKSHNGEMTKVFVPEGHIAISYGKGDYHPEVSISPSTATQHIKIFGYDVDDIVGRLVGDGSLTSWYRLAYLHTVTTSHLRDPLIHRTGLQQAQEMLASAQAFAFMSLEAEHNYLLQQILNLTPIRKYYPAHLTSMETVGWHGSLTPLSQCGRFVPLVNAIVDYACKQALFHSPAYQATITAEYKGKSCLWERAAYRVSRLVSNGSFLSLQIDDCDVLATPARCLDCPESIAREKVVTETAALVHRWPAFVNTTNSFDLWEVLRCWNSFSSKPVADSKIDNPQVWLRESPSEVWFRLFHLCRASLNKDRDQYGLMVAFGILAYRGDMELELIRILLAIATNASTNPVIRTATQSIPIETFDDGLEYTFDMNDASEILAENCYLFDEVEADSSGLAQQAQETYTAWTDRRRKAFSLQKESQCNALARKILNHGLCRSPILSESSTGAYPIVNIAQLRTEVKALFTIRLRNRSMFESVEQLQQALHTVRGLPQTEPIASLPPSKPPSSNPPPKYAAMTLGSLLQHTTRDVASMAKVGHSSRSHELILRLEGMAIDGPKSKYLADLSRCVDAFERRDTSAEPSVTCSGYEYSSTLEAAIQNALRPQTLLEQCLDQTGQWPIAGPEPLVQQLSRESWDVLPASWKTTLVRYAEGLAVKQQRRRIIILSRPGFEAELDREIGTRGGQGWDPSSYPDWLLVQLDADILIRPLQASIAMHMMFPESLRNALMQLNMGEGKSSVIVPIISAALADGEQLVRVIVLKPLSSQMFQLLKQRVCGLANRRLFYLPFSRDIQLDNAKIRQVVALFKECAQVGGILLCQPEHILSFQLMGLHAFCQSETSEESRMLMEAQEWLDSTARDILDESDEILNVHYQLIYTVGSAIPPEGRPWRWKLTQAVFSLLEKVAKTVADGLEINTVTDSRRFPVTRILTPGGRQTLVQSIVHEIVFEDGLQEWISFRTYARTDKNLVTRFLQRLDVSPDEDLTLRKLSGERFGHLLLLRGLFAYGILSFSLQDKRWRVEYGLDPKRSMLAVPYRAKDSPAPRAEFGHPDMIIVLTCLSYYYGGLTDDELSRTFKFLLNSDNPEGQYEHWVAGIDNLPAHLVNLRGLNLDDFDQKTRDIFPLLRYNKGVIDFYLSECVFPKEAREFRYKLTTNAWDLARSRPRLSTGFSGTNDQKYLLPLSIDQLDQDSQLHTNAQVLDYILQQENREVLCTGSDDARRLLQHVVAQEPCVMVLLDVGAQVLELRNEEVAREWLKLERRPYVEAAVYFDPSSDEIRVVSRDGRIQPLASSLYKKQLEKTLVYLDEAHTRGTDFKFPANSRAVVTLGPRLTKDKLVQVGCMRMRRLGKDHSVLFFASAEIRSKIVAATRTRPDEIDSQHVLLWTIQETCSQIRHNGSLWANQGLNFDTRQRALNEHRARPSYTSLVAALQERESRTLEELYGVKSRFESENDVEPSQLQIEIRQKCQELGIIPSDSALSEEQERELAHEKEDEREVERVPGAEPLDHCDDPSLHAFISTGVVGRFTNFVSLEDCLANTSWISLFPQGKVFRSKDLRATADFRDTISVSRYDSAGSMDHYLRPVQWILSTSKSDLLLLISPFQANKWLPDIRRSRFVHLHLYSPRVSRNTFWSFENLDSFTVPARPNWAPNRQVIHELNLFAGQLFCANKSSVKQVCGILGLHLHSMNNLEELQGKVDSTGFVQDEGARTALGIDACSFKSTPLPFFRELFASRRKGQGFALTHMGQILRGNDPKDPDFAETNEGEVRCGQF